jgi:hypothetical protein
LQTGITTEHVAVPCGATDSIGLGFNGGASGVVSLFAGIRADHAGPPASSHAQGGDRRRLGWALAITGLFMLVEVLGGLWSGSLALPLTQAHGYRHRLAYWRGSLPAQRTAGSAHRPTAMDARRCSPPSSTHSH